MSKYPPAVDRNLVGEYPAEAKSGAGYFYDDVLEYRVWCNPGWTPSGNYNQECYYCAFETYEKALIYSQETDGAGEPLVLVRQYEWINEPQPGIFTHEQGERLTEWHVDWLSEYKRTPGAIERFIRKKYN